MGSTSAQIRYRVRVEGLEKLRGVLRLDGVVRLDAIPLLGTGKTDYKVLRKMVAERSAASA